MTPKKEEAIVADPILNPTVQKKDPKQEQDNLTPDHPRFQEVYHEAQETKRELDRVRSEFTGLQDSMKTMMEHNKLLDSAIQNTQKVEQEVTKEPDISTQINDKRMELFNLRTSEEPDMQKIFTLESEIADLRDRNLTTKLSSMIPDTKKAFQEYTQANQVDNDKIAAKAFIESTPWMRMGSSEYVEMMDAAARGLEPIISVKYPNPVERFQKIKELVEAQFNWKGAGVDPPENLTVEDGGNPPKRNVSDIKLTEEEESMLNRLYAKNDREGARKRLLDQKKYLASLGRV
jgi:predicted RNase H-like nuclease (RuvC/YqgF family)